MKARIALQCPPWVRQVSGQSLSPESREQAKAAKPVPSIVKVSVLKSGYPAISQNLGPDL